MKKLTEENETQTKPEKKRVKKVSVSIPENTGTKTDAATDSENTEKSIPEIENEKLETVIDKTKEQKTFESKKDNSWIWALVGLTLAVLIAYLINKKNEETN